MKRLILTMTFICFVWFMAWGQKDSFFITSAQCVYLKDFKGSKLVLNHSKGHLTLRSSIYDYGLKNFINLPDRSKLILVEKLLKFKGDSTLCCLDITGHGFNGIEGCIGVPSSARYTIQIDALYIINRLCWPKKIERFSCYNVIYDTLTKEEINFDTKKVMHLFEEYESWYRSCLKKHKIGPKFPFNTGRYVWFGGRKDNSEELQK